jgi:1-deoxy-D-xylulose-5-phosphate synthase
MDEPELRNLMYTAQLPSVKHPFVIRYPRGQGVTVDWQTPFEKIKIGTGRKIRDGHELAILSYGHPGNFVMEACKTLMTDGIEPAHYDMRFVKPLDDKLLHEVFKHFHKILTIEDGCIMGGFGSAILEWMNEHGYSAEVKRLGIPDKVIEQGKPEQQQAECGFDPKSIVNIAREMMGVKVKEMV